MKRFFALLLAFALAFAMTACSPKPDPDPDDSTLPSGGVESKDNPFGDGNDPIDTPLVDLDPIS